VRIRYQSAFLGWLWALAPAVVRFAVLGVVFTALLPGQGPDYLAELAVGLLSWTWFSAGVSSATTSAADRSDLLGQAALPRQVVPVVTVVTDAFDYLAGVPALLLVVALDTGGIPATAVLLPVLLVLQGCLALGVGMAASVADVRYRDTRLAVALLLSVGFYATPVFYSLDGLASELQAVLRWNPVGALIEAQRDVLVHGAVPGPGTLAVLAAVCLGVLAAGWWTHRRCAPTFLDHL
jgi:ABC-type polysaccharide/polyol phosphate export permease